MIESEKKGERRASLLVWFTAALFAIAIFRSAAAMWADFGYQTFDLAYYDQALWRLVHGHMGTVSLLNVPLLGEHANVIVLFLVPFFVLIPHPLLPVAMQILAIASMGPVAFRIGRRIGLAPDLAAMMAMAALLTPATGFVALHEFHPEAFTAPFLLLAIDAYQRKSLRVFWIWFLATLSCKENMTLLLAAWCVVNFWSEWREWKRGQPSGNSKPIWNPERRWWALRWCVAPSAVALGWAVIYAGIISPFLNAGNIDFTGLYCRVMVPLPELPGAVIKQLSESLRGNMLPGLLLPLCGLSFLRPRWLLVGLPIVAQHLLSYRGSEWSIYFHYPAPLIPLVWVAACEALAGMTVPRLQKAMACAVVGACLAAQFWMGPARKMIQWDAIPEKNLEAKRAVVASVPPNASLVAGLPYLSHLAMRDNLVSLHHILKGLKTLSDKAFVQPPPGDVVIVDYADLWTFQPEGGYYHPAMPMEGKNVVPSSDVLLHQYLRRADWVVESRDMLTIFWRCKEGKCGKVSMVPLADPPDSYAKIQKIDAATSLLNLSANQTLDGTLEVSSLWRFNGERKALPWLMLRLFPLDGGKEISFHRGLCAPEGWNDGRLWYDRWNIKIPANLAHGHYRAEAVFFDNAKLRWERLKKPAAVPDVSVIVDLGPLGN